MYCPNCGANNLTDQKYCRACGLNIEDSAASLIRQKPSPGTSSIVETQRKWLRFGAVAWTGLLVVAGSALLFLIALIVDRFIISGANPVFGVIAILFFMFGAAMLTYIYKSQAFGRVRESEADEADMIAAPTGKLLDSARFEVPPTVVEDTTERLTPVSRDRSI